MITTAIVNLAYYLVTLILGVFPAAAQFPAAVHTAAQTIGGYFHMLDPIVPTDTFVTVFSLAIAVEVAIFGFKSFKWIISHLPFIGGNG